MTEMLVRRAEKTSPVPIAIKGTLLDLVTPTNGVDFGEPDGLYSSLNCLGMGQFTPLCPDGPGSKDFGGIQVIDGARFAVQNGVTCKSVGLDWTEIGAELERIQEIQESAQVENYLLTDPDATGNLLQGATNITPTVTGVFTPEDGLSWLQGATGGYAGQVTLHMPRALVSYFLSNGQGSLVWDGSALRTRLGDGVAGGLGYTNDVFKSIGPTGVAAAPGNYWIYATGTVQLARSETLQTRPLIKTDTNEVFILTERVYVASIDCFKVAVLVQLFNGS